MNAVGISGVNITKGYSAINKRRKVLFKKRYSLKKNKFNQTWIMNCTLYKHNTIIVGNGFMNLNGNQIQDGVIITVGKSKIYNYCTKGKVNIKSIK